MNAKTGLSTAQRGALLQHADGWIATGFGAGLVPRAPGTFASLLALLPWLALRALPLEWYIVALIIAFAIGVWACGVAGARIGVDDHRALVWDEFVGQWIALCALPFAWPSSSWPWMTASMLAGFVLFRLFDIWKPGPIRLADRRVHGGLGVMLDDALAGILTLIVLQIAAYMLRYAHWVA